MSTFGILHTVISTLPVGFGLVAFVRDGKIDPRTWMGKLYLATMFAGSISSWGFILTKGFTPAQVLTLLTLALIVVGLWTLRGRWRTDGYVQTLSLTTSYLLLWIFLTTETLTRVPVGNPFASGPADPVLLPVRLGLLGVFVVGLGYQLLRLRTRESSRITTAGSLAVASR